MDNEFELNKKLFKNYLRVEKSLSENTISSYLLDLDKFFHYVQDVELINNIRKISQVTVNGFLNYIDKSGSKFQKKYSSKSVSRLISSLKSFFKFLQAENIITENPLETIDSPKNSRTLPDVLSVEEIELIFSKPNVNDKYGLRDRAIMETMYSSGLRVSETINLEISSIYFEEEYLRILGKGSKERIVPINKTALKFVTKYIKESRNLFKNSKSFNYLFLNFRGSRFSRMGILDIIKKYCLEAEIRKNIYPHTFRHTFATHLLQGGADIRIIQELLGHSDISTTQIYTHIDKDYLIEVHKTFHPRA